MTTCLKGLQKEGMKKKVGGEEVKPKTSATVGNVFSCSSAQPKNQSQVFKNKVAGLTLNRNLRFEPQTLR